LLEPPPEMTLRAAAVAPPMSIESEARDDDLPRAVRRQGVTGTP
jgi:hypothetical protein